MDKVKKSPKVEDTRDGSIHPSIYIHNPYQYESASLDRSNS